MKPKRGGQEYEEYEEGGINSKRDGPSSNTYNTVATGNTNDENNNKANAIRSKHSVTEQRRRSKINERFQMLRDLMPNSNPKRDTASFLLEVIDHVKYLQERVQKYESSYPGWSSEPTKLTPWRNSHWHSQTLAAQQQATRSGASPVSIFPGKFEENDASIAFNVLASTQNAMELEAGQEVTDKSSDLHVSAPTQNDGRIVHPIQRPAGLDLPTTADHFTESLPDQPEDLSIEGGTISISSIYSQGLLNTLTDALRTAGVDLSEARISVKIDLNKQSHVTGASNVEDKDHSFSSNLMGAHVMDATDGEEGSNQTQKRQKT
ncbi:hypothetical protein SAY86_008661 [Trapa natans]|uniref:BHLH domain-containing protein n=1 Tax=Trapa natans TaxID=22666 RepID=A0AAN7KEB0_TRANT|nr:hypothetical protein SAY86_008661 [Trapa natans]